MLCKDENWWTSEFDEPAGMVLANLKSPKDFETGEAPVAEQAVPSHLIGQGSFSQLAAPLYPHTASMFSQDQTLGTTQGTKRQRAILDKVRPRQNRSFRGRTGCTHATGKLAGHCARVSTKVVVDSELLGRPGFAQLTIPPHTNVHDASETTRSPNAMLGRSTRGLVEAGAVEEDAARNEAVASERKRNQTNQARQ